MQRQRELLLTQRARALEPYETQQIADALALPQSNKLRGFTAVVTGAARGQGRSHAIALARNGANRLVLVDICQQISSVPYPMSTLEDMNDTVQAIRAANAATRISVLVQDTRNLATFQQQLTDIRVFLDNGIDIVVANAGIYVSSESNENNDVTDSKATVSPYAWRDVIDVNLNGTRNTIEACKQYLKPGASIVITSSALGLRSQEGAGAYTASKHALIGLGQVYAKEFGRQRIRVNCICPTVVQTPMVTSPATATLLSGGGNNGGSSASSLISLEKSLLSKKTNILPVAWVKPLDISKAVVFLASPDSELITGVALPVDAGLVIK